jgi:flagellar biosynthesis/type III secretory pathway protein FliH
MERVKQLNDEVDLATSAGWDAGYKEGMAQARHELAAELHRVGRDVASFQAAFEQTIVDIALATAKRAVGVQLDPTTTRRLAREAIAPHIGDTLYEIRVAPAVAERYRAALRDLAAAHPGTPMPVIRLDPRLPEGRAILFTKFASIDLDLDSQIEAMRLHLEA